MLHLWLAHASEGIRLFYDEQWHMVPNWHDLQKTITQLQNTKAKNKTSKAKNKQLDAKTVCLYVSTSSFVQANKPMSRTQLKQLGENGVRFLLEEDVLGSVEDLQVGHIMANDSQIMLCGINKHDIESYQQALSLAGLHLRAVLPDFLLLTVPKKNEATVYTDHATTIMRHGSHTGLLVDDVVMLTQRMPSLEKLNIFGAEQQLLIQTLADASIVSQCREDLSLTPVTQPERHPFNLMLKPKGAKLTPYVKTVFALTLLSVLTLLLYNGLRILHYQKLEKGYQAQIYKQYSQWFPNERPPVDIKKTIQSKMSNNADADNNPFSTISNVSALIKQSGLVARDIRLAQDAVEVSISASSIQNLESLVQRLNTQGLKAQLGSVTPQGSDVQGKITVAL